MCGEDGVLCVYPKEEENEKANIPKYSTGR
jgi:hypothetical protein